MEDEWVSCSELRKRLCGPAYAPNFLNGRLRELVGLGQLRLRLRAVVINGKIPEESSLEVDAKFLLREYNRPHKLRIDVFRDSLWSEASGGMSMAKLEGAGIMFLRHELEQWFADDFQKSVEKRARTKPLEAGKPEVAELPANLAPRSVETTAVPKVSNSEMEKWVDNMIDEGATLTSVGSSFRAAFPGRRIVHNRDKVRDLYEDRLMVKKGLSPKQGPRTAN